MRGAEAFDLLQALNTGHLGSLSTIHANSAEQALTRLAHCVLTANVGLPHRSIREAIALAIHLVVHLPGRRVTVASRAWSKCAGTSRTNRFDVRQGYPPDACVKESKYDSSCIVTGVGARGAVFRSLLRTGPAEPSAAPSFLAGTWRGTVTIEVNPGEAGGLPATTAATTWTFEVVPQTNMQTFRATVQSAHLWLPITTVASTALVPTNTPPTHIVPKAITTLHVAAGAHSAAPERRRRRESTRILPAWTVAPDSQDASCSPSNEAPVWWPGRLGARQLS